MKEEQDLVIDTNFGKIRNGNWLKIDLCILCFLVRSVLEASKEKPKATSKKNV